MCHHNIDDVDDSNNDDDYRDENNGIEQANIR